MFVKHTNVLAPTLETDSEYQFGGFQEMRILQSSSCDSDMQLGFRIIML